MSRRVQYRLAREADLRTLALVQSEAARWLAARQGRDVSAIRERLEPSPVAYHVLRTDPDLFWLAEVRGRPVGFSKGVVRGDLWLLSALFVHPDYHDADIGQELLRRCHTAGRARGARVDAVVSSAHERPVPVHTAGARPQVPDLRPPGPGGGPAGAAGVSASGTSPAADDPSSLTPEHR